MQFRKKPVIVEATRWHSNGDHPADDVWRPFEDTGAVPTKPREGAVVRYYRRPFMGAIACPECHSLWGEHGWIDILEGGFRVCPGDWVITGAEGERYPCKPSVFEAAYEPVVHGGADANDERSTVDDRIK